MRRIHDGFKKNKKLVDSITIETQYKEGFKNLEIIKRQVNDLFELVLSNRSLFSFNFSQAIIGQLYSSERLVIENIPNI